MVIKSSLVPCRPCCQDVKALTGHPPVLSASGARGALDIGWGGRGGAIIGDQVNMTSVRHYGRQVHVARAQKFAAFIYHIYAMVW